MAFDTTRLINQITLKGCLPTGRFQPDEILDAAYDVLISEIVPIISDVREEYYVRDSDSNITANQAAYPIVSRALAGALREIKMITTSNQVVDLTRIDPEDITQIRYGTPESFYLQGNDIILDPIPNVTTGSLRQKFLIRPSALVQSSSCAQISAIDPITNTVTVVAPSTWTTANTFDLIKGRAHFDILAYDLAASSVSAGSVQFSSSLPTTLSVGDYVCLAEQSCFPFLPVEGQMALMQATAAALQESMGFPQAAETAAKANMLKTNFKTILSVRVQGAPKSLGVRVL